MNDVSKQPDVDKLLEVLRKIGELAGSVAVTDPGSIAEHDGHVGCTIKQLPSRLREKGAEVARTINPLNTPVLGSIKALGLPANVTKTMTTVLTSKYWGPSTRTLTVSFMEQTPPDLRARIVQHMNAWSQTAGISFAETTGVGNVRISFGPGGYWSYLGTDIMLIPTDQPTMNLEGFSMATPESEYRRVVRHETGHTMGFPHEHMRQELIARIDRNKAYIYFQQTYGWDSATVDAQVLTPLDNGAIMGTPADQTSIMCYQLPGSITLDGQPIVGGTDINLTDYAFAAWVYPKISFQQAKTSIQPGKVAAVGAMKMPAKTGTGERNDDDWDPGKDRALPEDMAYQPGKSTPGGAGASTKTRTGERNDDDWDPGKDRALPEDMAYQPGKSTPGGAGASTKTRTGERNEDADRKPEKDREVRA